MTHARRATKIALAVVFSAGVTISGALTAKAAEDKTLRDKAELLRAIEVCDQGAAAPLDPSAKAPPVQYWELMPKNFDMTALKALQGDCQTAWVGAPDQTRLQLQWLRVTMMIGDGELGLLAPQLRALAKNGSAEANYLLYQLHRNKPEVEESTALEVSRSEAMKSLRRAAEDGHMGAIQEMMMLYRGTPGMKRDLKQVVLWARRMESAPPQGIAATAFEMEAREAMPFFIATTTLEEDGFPATENRLAFRIVERVMNEGGKNATFAGKAVAHALRHGRGTRQDPARAREILETLAVADVDAAVQLAGMLVAGEGGPKDGKRALDIVRRPDAQNSTRARSIEADILLAGDVVGYRPQEAIQALSRTLVPEDLVRLASLLVDYHTRIENGDGIVAGMSSIASSGDDDVALALARLKLSANSQFSDEEGARTLLKPLVDRGNREAIWLYASTQYSNLGSTSFRPSRRPDGLSDAELMALIDEGIRAEEPEAFLLKAKLLRAGIVYPQDDRVASDMLKQAAERDNVSALLLLGDAYDDGLGIAKDKRKRLDAWRRAAALGSLKAKSKIASAFTFDSFDRLMTLEEGVTWRIALYNNGYGRSFTGILGADSAAEMEFMGLFMGRAMEAGTDAVAEAVMNAFREAPAGLEDQNLVAMGKAFPPEIKVAIEKRLARDGFLRGSAEGYWGPDTRKALAAWVEAQIQPAATSPSDAETQPERAEISSEEPISKEAVGKLWDRIRADFRKAKTERQKRAALSKVNLLAQYGNIDARWALLPNYHQLDTVRRVVSAAEITRYGLDLMVAAPPSAEKVEFEFIFNATQIYQDGQSREFGRTVLAAIRDDGRLQDPLVLGGILKQFVFAPGACDAVLDAAKRAGIDDMGEDGCDETSLSALVAYAKAKGPAGIDARNREAAAEALRNL
jgi:TPR repeat protein